jgi:hypothetical protein
MKKHKTWIEDCLKTLIIEKLIRDEKYFKSIKRKSFKTFINYSKRAYKKGIEFYLIEKDFERLDNEPCFYCGDKPSGFDRIDSNSGYIRSNIVVCCAMCNMMKYVYSKDKFLTHINKIYDYNTKNRG